VARTRRPRLGQHFLVSENYRQQIVESLPLRADDLVLEIGPGRGAVTELLARRARRGVAVELDAELAKQLEEKLKDNAKVEIVRGDILTADLSALCRRDGFDKCVVFGNLPYYITSPILQRLFAALELIRDIHVVMQREVAERLAARPGTRAYGYLSVLAQFYTRPEILMPIPRGAFRPPPKVESALVWLAPPGARAALGVEDAGAFLRFAGACFRQKRKTLLNNLRGLHGAERVAAVLAAAGFDVRARAEELSLADFARLFRLL